MIRGITKYQREEQRYTLPSDSFLDVVVGLVCLFLLIMVTIWDR